MKYREESAKPKFLPSKRSSLFCISNGDRANNVKENFIFDDDFNFVDFPQDFRYYTNQRAHKGFKNKKIKEKPKYSVPLTHSRVKDFKFSRRKNDLRKHHTPNYAKFINSSSPPVIDRSDSEIKMSPLEEHDCKLHDIRLSAYSDHDDSTKTFSEFNPLDNYSAQETSNANYSVQEETSTKDDNSLESKCCDKERNTLDDKCCIHEVDDKCYISEFLTKRKPGSRQKSYAQVKYQDKEPNSFQGISSVLKGSSLASNASKSKIDRKPKLNSECDTGTAKPEISDEDSVDDPHELIKELTSQSNKAQPGSDDGVVTKWGTHNGNRPSITSFCINCLKQMPNIDPLTMFLQSISSTIKSMSPCHQALVKNKIFSIVNDLEMMELQYKDSGFANHSPHKNMPFNHPLHAQSLASHTCQNVPLLTNGSACQIHNQRSAHQNMNICNSPCNRHICTPIPEVWNT